MSIVYEIFGELREDRTALVIVAALVLLALARWLSNAHRERLRSSFVLVLVHVVLVLVAGVVRIGGSSLYKETRLAAFVVATLGFIGILATLIFGSILPRLRVNVPKIVQDVIVAGSSLVAVFVLASRAGLNLSGLIATSAVLTAVIGLAFQDTLGNIVGGLAIELDDSVSVGDWIKVGEVVGKVSEIRWRYTAIETRNWETVILPNSMLVKGQVTILGRREGQPIQWRRYIYFNVDFRYTPDEVIDIVESSLRGTTIENVAAQPQPECVLMELDQSFGRYAVRYWLTDLSRDNRTDSVIRTRIFYALRRARVPLSMPAQAVFVTEESSERKQEKSRVDQEQRLDALRHVSIFSGLSDEERALLADHLHRAPFAPKESITRQGAIAHWLYIIMTGEASVRVAVDGGREQEVARLGAGDFFGEMSLLTGERRSATVVALTSVECYRLDKSAFEELIVKRPELTAQIADLLARRRMELGVIRDDLGHKAQQDRLRLTQNDILQKIRSFFGLDENGPPRGK
ncbi:MAG TPA: mechanosensitive ion channel family protein [Polyangiaceae bacterium]|jgi:small-conductance mechanosensitive channel/CRP-like cAMP-binding protein|nr:mechanosensitive ion channel family protein [Polyangiaceae bacterium]